MRTHSIDDLRHSDIPQLFETLTHTKLELTAGYSELLCSDCEQRMRAFAQARVDFVRVVQQWHRILYGCEPSGRRRVQLGNVGGGRATITIEVDDDDSLDSAVAMRSSDEVSFVEEAEVENLKDFEQEIDAFVINERNEESSANSTDEIRISPTGYSCDAPMPNLYVPHNAFVANKLYNLDLPKLPTNHTAKCATSFEIIIIDHRRRGRILSHMRQERLQKPQITQPARALPCVHRPILVRPLSVHFPPELPTAAARTCPHRRTTVRMHSVRHDVRLVVRPEETPESEEPTNMFGESWAYCSIGSGPPALFRVSAVSKHVGR